MENQIIKSAINEYKRKLKKVNNSKVEIKYYEEEIKELRKKLNIFTLKQLSLINLITEGYNDSLIKTTKDRMEYPVAEGQRSTSLVYGKGIIYIKTPTFERPFVTLDIEMFEMEIPEKVLSDSEKLTSRIPYGEHNEKIITKFQLIIKKHE